MSYFIRPNLAILCLLFLFFGFQLAAETAPGGTARVWGKIVKVDKKVQGYEYFVTYSDGGRLLAYPIGVSSAQLESMKNKVDQLATITGEIKSQSFIYDGGQKIVYYFVPHKIELMNLYDISPKPKVAESSEGNPIDQFIKKQADAAKTANNNKVPSQGGIEISDKAANTAIAIGGAALLGSIIADIIK